MKVIDCTALRDNHSQAVSLDNILGSLKIGRSSSQDRDAQNILISAFQRALNNKYTMLQNVSLAGLDMPVPLLLVGPAGIWVLNPSGVRGVYRAKGESWEKIDDRKQTYESASENLLTHTEIISKAVEDVMAAHGKEKSHVEPVLVFTNPGVHIETVRPVVRVVLVDALHRFISGILQSRMVYDQEQVQELVDLFTELQTDMGKKGTGEIDDFTLIARARAQESIDAASANLDRFDTAFSRVNKLPFTSRQWIVLGALILVNIVILAAFVIYILFSS